MDKFDEFDAMFSMVTGLHVFDTLTIGLHLAINAALERAAQKAHGQYEACKDIGDHDGMVVAKNIEEAIRALKETA